MLKKNGRVMVDSEEGINLLAVCEFKYENAITKVCNDSGKFLATR